MPFQDIEKDKTRYIIIRQTEVDFIGLLMARSPGGDLLFRSYKFRDDPDTPGTRKTYDEQEFIVPRQMVVSLAKGLNDEVFENLRRINDLSRC